MSTFLFLLIRSLQILRSPAYSFSVHCSPFLLMFVINRINYRERELQLAIARYNWGSRVINGDRELKVAIASCKSRSRVISDDREL